MDRTKEALPERWRVNLLLRMILKENEQDIRLRYVQNIKTVTYAAVREQVFAYCTSNSKDLSGIHLYAMQDNNNDDDDEDLDALRKGAPRGASAAGAGLFLGTKTWHLVMTRAARRLQIRPTVDMLLPPQRPRQRQRQTDEEDDQRQIPKAKIKNKQEEQ